MATGPPKMRTANCAVCVAPLRCPFAQLHCEERSQLNSLIRHQVYSKGEIIFREGAVISGLYLLCDGKVKLACYTSEGRKQLIKFLHDGDCFGEEGFWQASPSSVSARALAESVIGWLSPGDFQELLSRNSSVALEIQKRLAGEVRELRVRLCRNPSPRCCSYQELPA